MELLYILRTLSLLVFGNLHSQFIYMLSLSDPQAMFGWLQTSHLLNPAMLMVCRTAVLRGWLQKRVETNVIIVFLHLHNYNRKQRRTN